MSVFENLKSELIDLNYLLEASEGDDDFIKMMLDSFLINTPTYLQDLNQLLTKKDYIELRACAHKFKGTVVIIGVESLKVLLETFEKASDSHDDNVLSDLLEKIKSISEQVVQEISDFLN